MKIFLVVSETHFYQPNFVAEFLRKTPDKIVGAALVTKTLPKNSLDRYLLSHWYYLRPMEIFKLAFMILKAVWLDKFGRKNKTDHFYSVRAALKYFHINYFIVENNINQPEYLKKIKSHKPDVIVSSNPLIFKEEILKLPKIYCLNRHSALLPSYGGLWPVLQAYRSGEKYTGVTIHTMVKEIDKGIILCQKKVPINKSDTIGKLYEKTFRLSAPALLAAIDKVRRRDFTPHKNNYKPSYFSFPTQQHWSEFRNQGGRFV